MKTQIMLLVAAMLLSAPFCGGVEIDPMTANLQSFSAPFNPRVPPVYPGSLINDEFRQQNPATVAPDPLGYVQLESKWSKYDPADELAFAVVDPQRQMALIRGAGNKEWHGVKQDLPLPTVVGGDESAIAFRIVARMTNAYILNSANADYGPLSFGLLLGENMTDDPDTTPLWVMASQLVRATEVDIGGVLSGGVMASALADYSAPPVPDAIVRTPSVWFAADVFSVLESPGVYDTNLRFLYSAEGESWQELYYYDLGDTALRQVALAQSSMSGVAMATWCDFIRVFPYSAGDINDKPVLGEILQFGSV